MSGRKLMLLDEPSMGLAPLLMMGVFDALKEINQEGTAILLVEQNARLALQFAQRGYVLESGNLVLEGKSADLLEDPEVKKRCKAAIEQNKTYKVLLEEHTRLREHVSITDFRSFEKTPSGNRFLVYSLFPETVVNIKIHYDNKDKEKVHVHVGHSIFNRNCNVNVGLMLSEFGGGGHRGAGGTRLHVKEAEKSIVKIIDILLKNEKNE